MTAANKRLSKSENIKNNQFKNEMTYFIAI